MSDIATCGGCGLSWDDSLVTSMTPAPSARCPFEAFHSDEGDELEPDDIPAGFVVRPIPDPIDVCAACGQSILTTPDDPPATLLCDVCLASLERRKALRPGTIAAIPPQGGLF